MNRDATTMLVWRILAELSNLQNVRILQFPIQPKYDNFSFVDLAEVIGISSETKIIGVNLATNE